MSWFPEIYFHFEGLMPKQKQHENGGMTLV